MANEPVTRADDDAESESGDLGGELSRLSAAAFALATAGAESGDFAAERDRAQALSDRLGELWPRVEAAAPAERAGLERSWSDARLDLGYVLSDGELSPSIRLFRARLEREAPPTSPHAP